MWDSTLIPHNIYPYNLIKSSTQFKISQSPPLEFTLKSHPSKPPALLLTCTINYRYLKKKKKRFVALSFLDLQHIIKRQTGWLKTKEPNPETAGHCSNHVWILDRSPLLVEQTSDPFCSYIISSLIFPNYETFLHFFSALPSFSLLFSRRRPIQ